MGDLKTTELISSSGSEEQNNFPVKISYHCSFPFNATHAIVTGGVQDGSRSANTWFVDLATTTFTPGPTMKTERIGHGCSTFQHGTKSFAIVSGGLGEDRYSLDSTEMIELDQESPTWTEGPKLPRKLETLTLVETSQGTYAMGGCSVQTNILFGRTIRPFSSRTVLLGRTEHLPQKFCLGRTSQNPLFLTFSTFLENIRFRNQARIF